MPYSGGWRDRGSLTYAARRPFRPATNPGEHDGRGDGIQPGALERITGPKRQGQGDPALIDEESGYTVVSGARGWRGDRTPHDKSRGYVGRGGAPERVEHAEAYRAHGEDYGADEEFMQDSPAMFQHDRKVVGWNQPRITAKGHGSQAALGRGLNGLDMNNDPSAQHYAINQVGVGRVERKFPSRRIWTRYLTPFRIRTAMQATLSRPSEVSPATSWAPTMTLGRTGKTTQPMLRRAPRDWTEAVTVDDSASGVAESVEPSWGL